MRINHNIQALNAYRNLSQTMNSTSKSLEKLSSGLRINKASDDAAGLAISEKMRSQIRGLDMAERNTLDAISLIQTGEGALNEVHSILQRMRELSVQASNGTLEDSDRQAIQDEIDQLTKEVDRIADTTQFNQKKLFSGDAVGRAFASLDSSKVPYTGNGTWEGNVTAEPTDPASVELKVDRSFGELNGAAVDGTTFTIGGKTYEIDAAGGTVGVADQNIAVSVAWTDGATTDEAIKGNIESLLDSLAGAISENDSTFDPTISNPNFLPVEEGVVEDSDESAQGSAIIGKLVLTTKDNMSPKNADALSVEVNPDTISGVQFVDPADSTTPATHLVAEQNAIASTSLPITFTEVPKANDELQIGNLTITFTDGPSSPYSAGAATIDVTGKDIFTVLGEVKNIISAAQLDTVNKPLGDMANTFDVVGTTLIVGTTTTETTTPNGLYIKIKDGDFEADKGKDLTLNFQIGANSSETLEVSIGVMDAGKLGIGYDKNGNPVPAGVNAEKGVNVMSESAASAAIDIFDNAVKLVSSERSKLGALQNRLEHTTNNLQTANENLTSAESRIRDLDMAEAMTDFTRNNILNQAGQAMLAQANQLPQGILQLLK